MRPQAEPRREVRDVIANGALVISRKAHENMSASVTDRHTDIETDILIRSVSASLVYETKILQLLIFSKQILKGNINVINITRSLLEFYCYYCFFCTLACRL